ncbi:hypothetical protein [Roseococcus sp. YIM B11640]|uniref:hypothetical protein n=1 Tax=Roseococcus sp. YIM B11640 TaxID=3133973 RepID=UPI003C7D8A72
MTKFLKIPVLAAALAVPMALAAGGAQAQIATYCNGSVSANAFYNNVQSNGRNSTVLYYAQFQNRTNRVIPLYSVTFSYTPAHDRISGSPPPPAGPSLQPYQQVTVLLGKQNFTNPSGHGALSPYDLNNGVPHAVSVICAAF